MLLLGTPRAPANPLLKVEALNVATVPWMTISTFTELAAPVVAVLLWLVVAPVLP
jgi:hypothetical protein